MGHEAGAVLSKFFSQWQGAGVLPYNQAEHLGICVSQLCVTGYHTGDKE